MPGRVELIAYADRFGGDAAGLRALLDGPAGGAVRRGPHAAVLRPLRRRRRRLRPGGPARGGRAARDWDDVAALSRDLDLMVDVIVNHVSSASPSSSTGWPVGRVAVRRHVPDLGRRLPRWRPRQDLVRLYRPRPGLPFTTPRLVGGRTRWLVWTTFTAAQVDLDVRSPATRLPARLVLDRLAPAGVSHVRLGAVESAVKTPGTSVHDAGDVAFVATLTGGAVTAASRSSSRCTPTTSARWNRAKGRPGLRLAPRHWSCTR